MMTNQTNLVERLRDWSKVVEGIGGLNRSEVLLQAADRISQLERQLSDAAPWSDAITAKIDEMERVAHARGYIGFQNRVTELRALLAQRAQLVPEAVQQEPVALRAKFGGVWFYATWVKDGDITEPWEPLYASPASTPKKAQPAQTNKDEE